MIHPAELTGCCHRVQQPTSIILTLLLELNFSWQVATVVKTSQLPVLTVDPNVHTGALYLTGFYRHFDNPQQYKTMLLPVNNG